MTINHGEIDYWFYTIGANVIPVDSKNKIPTKEWKIWQDKPIPNESFEQWKEEGIYNKGIAIITGKIWRGAYKGKYLICIDIDNKKGIEEFLSYFPESKTLEELAEITIVEQHSDNKEDKTHIYYLVEKSLTRKSGIKGAKNNKNEIPAIEVKSEGSHGIMVCTPFIHKEGQPYKIIGANNPAVLDKEQSEHLEDAINKIYNKYEGNSKKNKENRIPIENLFKEDYKVSEGNNRHEDLLRVMESHIARNKKTPTEGIKREAYDWNQKHCDPPLDDKEFEKQWTCATKFIEKKNINETEEGKEGKEKRAEDVSNILNDIKERYLEIFKIN